jgi:hypothetical protein
LADMRKEIQVLRQAQGGPPPQDNGPNQGYNQPSAPRQGHLGNHGVQAAPEGAYMNATRAESTVQNQGWQ